MTYLCPQCVDSIAEVFLTNMQDSALNLETPLTFSASPLCVSGWVRYRNLSFWEGSSSGMCLQGFVGITVMNHQLIPVKPRQSQEPSNIDSLLVPQHLNPINSCQNLVNYLYAFTICLIGQLGNGIQEKLSFFLFFFFSFSLAEHLQHQGLIISELAQQISSIIKMPH